MEETQNETQRLITYAKLDRELHRYTILFEEVPADLKSQSELLKQVTEEVARLEANVAEWEKTERDLGAEQETDAERRKGREGRLNAIQNVKEHHAALKEIEETKRRTKIREDNLLELGVKIEQGKAELQAAQAKHSELEKSVLQRMAALNEERETVKQEIEAKRKERDYYATTVNGTLLKKYAHISKLRQPPIAPIENGVCSECHMQLPPQQYIEMQKSQSFMVCPSCQRLLYIEYV